MRAFARWLGRGLLPRRPGEVARLVTFVAAVAAASVLITAAVGWAPRSGDTGATLPLQQRSAPTWPEFFSTYNNVEQTPPFGGSTQPVYRDSGREPSVAALLEDPELAAAVRDRRVQQYWEMVEYYYRGWDCPLRDESWDLDFSSLAAFRDSVEPWRERFRAEIGGLPAAVAQVRVQAREPVAERDGYRVEYLILESRVPGVTVHAYLLTPDPARFPRPAAGYPAVVALHGTHSTPESVIELTPDDRDYSNGFGARLAERGVVVVVPDVGQNLYVRDRIRAVAEWAGTPSAMGMHVQRVVSAVDFIASLPDVNPDAIGMYGVSWGGQLAQWAAALDQRVAAVVVSGWFRDFATWFCEQVNPGQIETHLLYLPAGFWARFNASRVGTLIAPRPTLIEASSGDLLLATDSEGFGREWNRLGEVYRRLGAEDGLELISHPGGHYTEPDEPVGWLVEQLSKATKSA